MRRRTSYNPKRSLGSQPESAERQALLKKLARRVHYGGNPEHKKNPGDFGLQPPSSPRMGKTLCDSCGILTRAEALQLLQEGLRRGLISVQWRGEWPQNVWAVTDSGCALEAQMERDGIYHGYPMAENDPLRAEVLRRWVA